MTDSSSPTHLFEELVRRFAAAVRAVQLYRPDHPLVARSLEAFSDAVAAQLAERPSLVIGLLEREVVVADTPLPRAAALLGDLLARLLAHHVERITIDRGVTRDELLTFARALASLPPRPQPGAPPPSATWTFAHIRTGRIAADEDRGEGIASDMQTIRRLYNEAVAVAEVTWDAAATEGLPDLPGARQVVDGLADAVSENRTALVALTAMKAYDNYTFTHMVNVSILTMAQARALGIEGRLLREFGLAALMHDIGKVRTPKDILNKPDKLTEQEFAIMKRHTVDGAEILRRTPEMPILAPVVAFEHHLRLDGTGYPDGVRRGTLNLGTQLCSIADVYDAMRSQRAYQQAFPTDRILAVLQRNDGRQFDQHLVRRFSQIMGIYPPGNLVRLSTGEVAVVVKVHAPDPFRPRVRVLFGRDGQRLAVPVDRNLWEPRPDTGTVDAVAAPLDPADYGVDPLSFL